MNPRHQPWQGCALPLSYARLRVGKDTSPGDRCKGAGAGGPPRCGPGRRGLAPPPPPRGPGGACDVTPSRGGARSRGGRAQGGFLGLGRSNPGCRCPGGGGRRHGGPFADRRRWGRRHSAPPALRQQSGRRSVFKDAAPARDQERVVEGAPVHSGRITLSITCTTPFLASMSVFVTWAPPTRTLRPSTRIAKSRPSSVGAFSSFTTWSA